MERRRALEEITARRHGRDEGRVIVLSGSDEEVTAPSQPPRSGDPEEGYSQAPLKDRPPRDGGDDDGGDDYTAF